MKLWQRRKIGLALGCGAARGLAHIGVLEVLEEEKIPIHFIAGTSMGALIGGFYASGLGIKKLKEFAYQTDWKKVALLFAPSPSRSGLVSGKRIEKLLRSLLGNRKIEELPIPFACVATDIVSGKEVMINQGDLVDGIRASISIQGILTPIVFDGRILVDGGIINPLPVTVASKMGADFIIASNVNSPSPKYPEEIKNSKTKDKIEIPNIFSIILQSANIMQQKITQDSLSQANLIINSELSDVKLLEFYRAREVVEIGRASAKKTLSKNRESMKILGKRRGKKWIRS